MSETKPTPTSIDVPAPEPVPPPYQVPPPAVADEIRGFANDGIQSAIDGALATLPEGKSIAVVGYVDYRGSVRASVMFRLPAGWSLVAVASHTPGRRFAGEAGVLWSR